MKKRKNVLLALSWYNGEIHRGVVDFARNHNWNLCTETVNYAGMLPDDWVGDGIITQLFDGRKLDFVRKSNLDVVNLGPFNSKFECDSLMHDHEDICRRGAEYLVEKGYKRFAWYTNKVIKNPVRLRLFQKNLPADLVCHHLDFPTMVNWRENRIGLIERLREMQFPVAVFCSDDNAAAEVITACLDAEIKVPEEVAVLGVNNDPLICEGLAIPLSSVNLDYYHYGYLAAYLLDRRMRGKAGEFRRLVLKAKGVVTRQSTDAIAVDHPEVAKALAFIHRNFAHGVKVKDVVLSTNLTECGLSRAFQAEIGRTIGQELRRVKLDMAEKMLAETNKNVNQIAQECGFGNYHGLYEAFIRSRGITPRQIRKVGSGK